MATNKGDWIMAVPHCLNVTYFSQEEFRDNFCLRYGLMTQDNTVAYNGCMKNFSVDHGLS